MARAISQQPRRRRRHRVVRGGYISGPVFKGAQYMAMRRPILYDGMANNQRGKGVGAWLSGLFRSAIPLFRSGGKAVGKQLLSSGLDMARDLAFNKVPLKQTFNRRMGEAGDALGEKFKDKISSLSGTGLGGCRKRKSSRGRGSVVKRRRLTTTIRKRT